MYNRRDKIEMCNWFRDVRRSDLELNGPAAKPWPEKARLGGTEAWERDASRPDPWFWKSADEGPHTTAIQPPGLYSVEKGRFVCSGSSDFGNNWAFPRAPFCSVDWLFEKSRGLLGLSACGSYTALNLPMA